MLKILWQSLQEVARAKAEFMETFRSLKLPFFVTMIVKCQDCQMSPFLFIISISFLIIATVASDRIITEPQPTGFLASLPPVLFRILKRFANQKWLLSKQQNHCAHNFLYYIILTNDQVAAAKEEFFRIFEAALNGMIETRFMRDTAEVLTLLLLLMFAIIIAGSCIIVLTL